MESRKKPEISPFDSVDPAPPSQESNITNLSNTLSDENEKMFQRMRALFALRNIGGHESVDALTNAFNSESALLKHEIAYVLGQMQDPHAVPSLIDRLSDTTEDVMVRHEAAEALGAIGDMIAMDLRLFHRSGKNRSKIIRLSCINRVFDTAKMTKDIR